MYGLLSVQKKCELLMLGGRFTGGYTVSFYEEEYMSRTRRNRARPQTKKAKTLNVTVPPAIELVQWL